MTANRNTNLVGSAMLAAACMTGCGNKSDANEANFAAAIEAHLKEAKPLCLGTERWPVDLPAEMDALTTSGDAQSPSARMRALEKAGMVSASEIEVDEGAWFGKTTGRMRKVTRYTLAEAAKPYTRDSERVPVASKGGPAEFRDLCWGRKALDKVVKWEGPMEFGAFKTARVIYTYSIVDVAEWAKRPEVQQAFPAIGAQLQRAANEDVEGVKLTSEGWEVSQGRF